MEQGTIDVFSSINLTNHSHHQIGKIGEYWAKLILTLYGFEIYTSEVDEKGIDFVLRFDESKYFDVQVKTFRTDRTHYVFAAKQHAWEALKVNLYMALVRIDPKNMPPILYFIPSTAWSKENALLRNREYSKFGKKSKDEWGLNLSAKNFSLLEEYKIENQVRYFRKKFFPV